MSKNFNSIFGVLLIVGGVLLGLQQFGILGGNVGDALFTGLWVIGALYFGNLFLQDRAQWWFALIALILGSWAVSGFLDLVLPGFAIGDTIGGALFLGAIGAGFLVAYTRQRSNWWAVIPAGVLFTLAFISIVDGFPGLTLPFESGSLLFFGLGLTFMVLSFMNVEGQRLSWALIPAVVLVAFGLFVGFGEAASWSIIWPSLIILFGAYFLLTSFRRS
jgi:hypothetical protein